MDPISQAAVGAAAAQGKSTSETVKQAAVIGALAGMAPDLDILIRSSHDPLLELEFHRHFTHSLIFIPIGASICALFFYWFLNWRWKLPFGRIYLWSLLGFATHGLLDGCTTYGTQLLWPFSDTRIAWNTISVIDPLFTLPLIAAVLLTIKSKTKQCWWLGLAWCSLYLCFGWLQNDRAVNVANTIATNRGHEHVQIVAKPSFANIIVWKTVYEHGGYFYVDAVRPGVQQAKVWRGSKIRKIDLSTDFPWLDPNSQQAKDIERFRHFSSGYIGVDPRDANSLVDIRYSLLPDKIDGLWGIRLDPNAPSDGHVTYYTQRDDARDALKTLISMLFH